MKTAVVFGASGMDGTFLVGHLLGLNYRVLAASRFTAQGTHHPVLSSFSNNKNFHKIYCDVTDAQAVNSIIAHYAPNEVYNLAAQSHVGLSYHMPCVTYDTIIHGTQNILSAILNICPSTKYYNASSSEMFGSSRGVLYEDGIYRQDEFTTFMPQSPYAIAKLASHHITRVYRERGIFACCGILFNHDSEIRGLDFFTRKVSNYCAGLTKALSQNRKLEPLRLGNLAAKRDIGYAGDYVVAMHQMLQQDYPDDYVIATGQTHTMEQILKEFFKHVGVDYYSHVIIDKDLYRPTEVDYLCGHSNKAFNKFGWKAKYTMPDIVKIMYNYDLNLLP